MYTIVIPFSGGLDYLKECLESIKDNLGTEKVEVVLIDNGTPIEYLGERLESLYPMLSIQTIRSETNMGFPWAINRGMEQASGDIIIILNSDTIVTPDWIENLSWGLVDGFDTVGPVSNYVAGAQRVIIDSYTDKNTLYEAVRKNSIQESGKITPVNWIIGVCMMARREVWDDVGTMDESFGLGNSEDLDWCWRANLKGYKLGIVKDAYIHHYGNVTHRLLNINHEKLLRENNEKLRKKWQGLYERYIQQVI